MAATQKNQLFDPGFLFTPSDSFSLGRTVSPQYKTSQTDDRQTRQCTKSSTDSTVGQKPENVVFLMWNQVTVDNRVETLPVATTLYCLRASLKLFSLLCFIIQSSPNLKNSNTFFVFGRKTKTKRRILNRNKR